MVLEPGRGLEMSPTCTGCLTVDECWGLQPEAAALLLCKHKTQLSSACGGRSTAKQGAWWAWDPREWSRLQQESRRSMLQYGSAARPAQGTWRMKMLRQNYISARLWATPSRKGSDGTTGQAYNRRHARLRSQDPGRTCLQDMPVT